jgi:hypothetical protein
MDVNLPYRQSLKCVPFSVLGVGDRVADDVLKENLQNTASLLVDETGDTLDTTTAGQATNSRFGDTCGNVSDDEVTS